MPIRVGIIREFPECFFIIIIHKCTGEGMNADKHQISARMEGLVIPSPRLTKPDSAFHAMGLEFVNTKEGIVLTELNDLFEK